ncbi:MAG TPA: guanylate kinase [Anaerolineaceae bacterium]|nr:guanylate kinase [Anaerolineaceae bacterium]
MCIESQQVDSTAGNIIANPEPLLIVISGPSGAGKDAVVRRLMERCPNLYFVVTATTRAPRPGEEHGMDYFFVSHAEFERMIAEDELLEHTLVYGDYKGIPKQQIRKAMASGKDVILRVDVQGAATVRRLCPDSLSIFITPPTQADLDDRLRNRRSESDQSLKIRLDAAHKELDRLDEFDYLVINNYGQLDLAVDAILDIIKAEHMRVHPRKISL